MTFVYCVVLRLMYLAISIASLFNEKAKKWIQGRKGIFEQIKQNVKSNGDIIWFHSASLGEFEQGRPVIEELKKKNPDCKILVTFFSPSGYEIRKNYPQADYIYYLPIDYKVNAIKFIELVKPKAVFFIKYEFWHNYLVELKKRNIPTYCISANFRENQLFFKWYGGWYRNVLNCFDHIFVQNERSKKLLSHIGLENVTVTGDTRFDRVHHIAQQAKQLPIVEQFCNGKQTIVAGSTWPADEALLVRYINETKHNCKFIIAPHEIHKEGIDALVASISVKSVKYSEAEKMNTSEYDVLIIDNIGMLSSVYQYGKVSYIGGGFGKGIHNILEAATFALPIFFGPKYKKFQEAVDLAEEGGAFPIKSYEQLRTGLDNLLSYNNKLEGAANVCKSYVASNIGATGLIMDKVGL